MEELNASELTFTSREAIRNGRKLAGQFDDQQKIDVVTLINVYVNVCYKTSKAFKVKEDRQKAVFVMLGVPDQTMVYPEIEEEFPKWVKEFEELLKDALKMEKLPDIEESGVNLPLAIFACIKYNFLNEKTRMQKYSYEIYDEDERFWTKYYVEDMDTMRTLLKSDGFFNDEQIEEIANNPLEIQKKTGKGKYFTKHTLTPEEKLLREYVLSSYQENGYFSCSIDENKEMEKMDKWLEAHEEIAEKYGLDGLDADLIYTYDADDNLDDFRDFDTPFGKKFEDVTDRIFGREHIHELTYELHEDMHISTSYHVDSKETMRKILDDETDFNERQKELFLLHSVEYDNENKILFTMYRDGTFKINQ